MESLYMQGDDKRLYFRNYNRIPDEEEYKMIMQCLKNAECVILDKKMGPYCDIIRCIYKENEFDVVRTIDGDGTFIYSDNHDVLEELEAVFKHD